MNKYSEIRIPKSDHGRHRPRGADPRVAGFAGVAEGATGSGADAAAAGGQGGRVGTAGPGRWRPAR